MYTLSRSLLPSVTFVMGFINSKVLIIIEISKKKTVNKKTMTVKIHSKEHVGLLFWAVNGQKAVSNMHRIYRVNQLL